MKARPSIAPGHGYRLRPHSLPAPGWVHSYAAIPRPSIRSEQPVGWLPSGRIRRALIRRWDNRRWR